jgi:hypothetical protein
LTHANFPKRQVLDIGARLQLPLNLERAAAKRFLYEKKEVGVRVRVGVEVEVEVEEKVGRKDPSHKRRQTSKPSHLMRMTVRLERFSTCVHISFMLSVITLQPLHGLGRLIAILLKW